MASQSTDIVGAYFIYDIYLIRWRFPLYRNERSVAVNMKGHRLYSYRIATLYENGAFIKQDYYCDLRYYNKDEYNEVYFKINEILFLDYNIPSNGQQFFLQSRIKAGYHLYMKEIVNANTDDRYCNMHCIFKDKDFDSYNRPGINVTDVIPRHESKNDEIVIGFRIIIDEINQQNYGQRSESRFGPNRGYGGVFQMTQNDSISIPTLREYMTQNDYFGIYINPNARLILKQECATLIGPTIDPTNPRYITCYKYSDKNKTQRHHERTLFLGGTYIFAEGLLGFMFPQTSNNVCRLEDAETDISAFVDSNNISIDRRNPSQLWLFLNEIGSEFNTICWGLLYLDNQTLNELGSNVTEGINWCLVIPEDARIEKISGISEGITDTIDRLRDNDTTKQYELTKEDQSLTSTSTGTPQSSTQGAQHIRSRHYSSQQTNPRYQSHTPRQQSFRSNTPHSHQYTSQPSVSTPPYGAQMQYNQPLFPTYNPNPNQQSVFTDPYNPYVQSQQQTDQFQYNLPQYTVPYQPYSYDPQTGQMLYNTQPFIPIQHPNLFQQLVYTNQYPPHFQQHQQTGHMSYNQQPIISIQYQQQQQPQQPRHPRHPRHPQYPQLSTPTQRLQPYYGNNTPTPFGFHPNQQQ